VHLFEENPELKCTAENVLVSSDEMVLMQTAKTYVKADNGDTTEGIRVLLYSGSQRKYVT